MAADPQERHTGASAVHSTTSVVIVGGGYAGMIASNRLWASLTPEERRRVRVTLINRSDQFVHRIRLHEHAAGTAEAILPLRSMIHDEVNLVVGNAQSIDAGARTVLVSTRSGPRTLAYDWMIYAVGSYSSKPILGGAEHALSIADITGARAIRQRLTTRPTQRVCVIGGGPAGVETAAELAEAYPRASVALIAGAGVMPRYRPAARRSITRDLRKLGVDIIEGSDAQRVEADRVHMVDGREVPADTTVWAAGFDVPDLARRSGLPVDSTGRLLVDEGLFCIADARIIGAGDAVKVPDFVGAHLPMGARVALPLGGFAADAVLARIRLEEARPISLGLLGPSLSLGRHRGHIQLTHADDTPTSVALTGRLAAAIKAWVCRMTIDSPREERLRPGAYHVRRGPRTHRGEQLERAGL